MSGLTAALNAAKTSITTNQKAIEIVGNNIANVNTPGYSRQTPYLSPYPTLSFGDLFIGTGVRVGSVERATDSFLTKQIATKSGDLGYENAKSTPLASIERILPIDGSGVASAIDAFFDAWQELSTNPDGAVERELVIQHGNLVTDALMSTYNNLETVRTDIDNQLVSKIDGVNTKLREIADLNNRIATIEETGNTANSDRDRRDQLVKELSDELGVQSLENSRGMITLQLPGGLPLVDGANALQISSTTSGTTLQLQLSYGSTNIALNGSSFGGQFRGLLEIRDDLVPQLQGQLDQLAFDLATAVNSQHSAGTGADGVSGRDFFVQPTTVDGAATTISVALTDNNQIAAGFSNSDGDNRNALNISALRTTTFVNGNDSYTSWYGKMAATVGMEANQNELSLTGIQDTLVQLENVRDSTVGVSLEEEMISLVQYQKGFEAAAQYLTTIDEMMASLLSIKR